MAKLISPRDVYELVENEKGEIMVLIYAKKTAPQNATFYLDTQTRVLRLNRSKEESLYISGLQPDAIKKLNGIKKLYVCEIKYTESTKEESEIVHAYAATLQKLTTPTPHEQDAENKKTLAQKAQNAREKALKESAQ